MKSALNLHLKKLIVAAFFASLTCVLSQISIPLPFTPVPINLALISVFLSGGLLGAGYGALSQIIFVALGAVGLPVFAKLGSGLGTLFGPTGGFIFGYVAAAFIIGLILQKTELGFWIVFAAILAGLLVCYVFGVVWFMFISKTGFFSALALCVLPFLIGDAFKIILSAFLILRLKRFIS